MSEMATEREGTREKHKILIVGKLDSASHLLARLRSHVWTSKCVTTSGVGAAQYIPMFPIIPFDHQTWQWR
jgi:hypothetical protein